MNKKTKITTLFISQGAIIAALYVALSWVSHVVGLDSGVIQCRISEALCILPIFTPAAIPGLTIGCVISNLTMGCVWQDIIFGSFATLIGAVGAYLLRKGWLKWLAPIPTIVANAAIVPFVLKYAYGMEDAFWFMVLTVAIGEVISAGIFGTALSVALEPVKNKIFKKIK